MSNLTIKVYCGEGLIDSYTPKSAGVAEAFAAAKLLNPNWTSIVIEIDRPKPERNEP